MRAERTAGILRITLDRPNRLNALDVEVLAELSREIRAGGADPAVRVIVLSGEGRAFCTGADLTALDGPPEALMDAANTVIRDIVTLSVPVVAAVHGPAAGFGVSLACAADLTFAARSAYFLLSFVNIGLMPDGGASWLVPAAIGRARAAEMALLGDTMSAAEACEFGLVTRTLPDDQLADHVAAVATKLAAGSRRAQELTKRALTASTLPLLGAALELERAGQIELLDSTDFAEGAAAFREKRVPRFTP